VRRGITGKKRNKTHVEEKVIRAIWENNPERVRRGADFTQGAPARVQTMQSKTRKHAPVEKFLVKRGGVKTVTKL